MSGHGPEDPYGQQDPYRQQDPYGQSPYGTPGQQPPYGQGQPSPYPSSQDPQASGPQGAPGQWQGQQPWQAPGQGGWQGQPYGSGQYHPTPYGQTPPVHSSATTSMVLGIVALGAMLTCILSPLLLLSPFAWAMGSRAVRTIDASNGALGGRDRATAGKVLGIIGTVLLLVLALLFVAFLVVAFMDPTTFEEIDTQPTRAV